MKDTVISVKNLTIAYNDKPVLWDNNLDFVKIFITAIYGPNAEGKSRL